MIRYKSKILKKIREGLAKGGGIGNACEAAGITSMSLWRWRKKYPRIDRYMESLTEHRVQLVEDSLYKAALKGNTPAQMFFLKVNRPGRYNIDKPLIDARTQVNNNEVNVIQIFDTKAYASKLKELNGKSTTEIAGILSESIGMPEAAAPSGDEG